MGTAWSLLILGEHVSSCVSLFSTFLNDLDDVVECVLVKSARNQKSATQQKGRRATSGNLGITADHELLRSQWDPVGAQKNT